MSFQGFAREQGFSDNQIRIDINSVIENDLAEANRQTKYLGRNADLEGQWGNMYLNKLIEKHEVEQRNRKENFNFFMKNREEIHKIVQYNNEVKYEDAGKNRHVKGLDSILGEGLLKLAVSVGSAAIEKVISDWKGEQDEAEKVAHNASVGDMKSIAMQSNPAQLKNLPKLMEDWHNITAKQQNERIAYHNSLGNPGQGQIEAVQIGNAAKLTPALRQNIAFSPDKVAIDYQTYSRSVSIPINGRNWTQAEILQASPNPTTTREFNRLKQAGFLKKIGFSNLNGTATSQVIEAVKRTDAAYSKQAYNSQVKVASVRMAEQDAATAESKLIQTNGDAVGVYKWAFDPTDPTSPAARMSMSEVHEVVRGWAKNGMFSLDMLRKIWEMPNFGGGELSLMQLHNLNGRAGTKASRAWKAIIDAKEVDNMKAHNNYMIKHNQLLEAQALEAPTLDKITARNRLGFFNSTKGQELLKGAKPGTAANLISALSIAAGVIPPQKTVSPGQQAVESNFTKPELLAHAGLFITDSDGKAVSLSVYDKKVPEVSLAHSKVTAAYTSALTDLTNNLITKHNLTAKSPQLKGMVLDILSDKKHPFHDHVRHLLKAKTHSIDANGNQTLLKAPEFPNLDLPSGATSFTYQYNKDKAAAGIGKNNFTWANINYNKKEYIDWARRVSMAKSLGGSHVQNVLSNPPPGPRRAIEDLGGSAWIAYMMALEHGGTPYENFKPLDGNDGMDQVQVDQLNAQYGKQYAQLQSAAQAVIRNNGVIHNHQAQAAPTRTIQPSSQSNVTSNANNRITQDMFGSRNFGKKGTLGSAKTKGGHTGRDVSLPRGTTMAIGFDWVVVDVENSHTPGKGYGRFVVGYIPSLDQHFKSNHHDANYVQIGQQIKAGQVYATVGSTGLSTGSHAHLDVTAPGVKYVGHKGSGLHGDTWQAFGGVLGGPGPQLIDPDSFILNGGLLINMGGN